MGENYLSIKTLGPFMETNYFIRGWHVYELEVKNYLGGKQTTCDHTNMRTMLDCIN